ncbi:MAG: hypothetical protein IKU34_09860 [Clostridia bacterium]|nr:hypothetical protein [Clostridia bacterium]
MNRKNITCAAGLLLAAMLTISPMNAVAAETTALASGAQGEPTKQGEVIKPFGRNRGYLGVSASNKWMAQARIGGLMLNLRLFTPQGDFVTFQENLGPVEGNREEICLTLRASHWEDELVLQIDQPAMDVLARVGVTKIVIADDQRAVRARYDVSELQQIRDHFGLTAGEQLCVSGEDSPVTVVGEDGFRRQITR